MNLDLKKMNPDFIVDELKAHYKRTFAEHGPCAKGVDWRDEQTANVRHAKLFKLFEDDHQSTILDVGCGYGRFYEYLLEKKFSGQYYGIDVVEEMIEQAQLSHGFERFENKNFLDLGKNKKFDYLVVNGIFTQKLGVSQIEMEKYMLNFIEKLFDSCNKGIAFNVMSNHVNFFANNLFYKSPSELISYISSKISPNFVIDHSYGMFEYTVYIYKEVV